MFKLKTDHEFTWPVKVQVPVEDGRFEAQEFTGRFVAEAQDAVDAALAGAEGDRDLLKRVLVGWSQLGDEDGRELPFSAEARDRLVGIPYVRVALMEAYMEAITGGRLQAKN